MVAQDSPDNADDKTIAGARQRKAAQAPRRVLIGKKLPAGREGGEGADDSSPITRAVEFNGGDRSDTAADAAGSAEKKRTREATVTDAVRTIRPEDFALDKVAASKCARSGLMTGIIAAGLVFGVRIFAMRALPLNSANWAVGGFLVGGVASHELCQHRRRIEKRAMREHVRLYQDAQRAKAVQAAAQARRVQTEERGHGVAAAAAAAGVAPQPRRAWYRFW